MTITITTADQLRAARAQAEFDEAFIECARDGGYGAVVAEVANDAINGEMVGNPDASADTVASVICDAMADFELGAVVATLTVDASGRIVTEPATMVALVCGCHDLWRGEFSVGDTITCEDHGDQLVGGAILTGITV